MQVIATLISLLKGMLKLDEYSTLQNSFHQVHEQFVKVHKLFMNIIMCNNKRI